MTLRVLLTGCGYLGFGCMSYTGSYKARSGLLRLSTVFCLSRFDFKKSAKRSGFSSISHQFPNRSSSYHFIVVRARARRG
ncbi:hypothetical protein NEOLEDRAFT_740941 [Neolentinus lepideus HHB14362 ss-1]|uniref:Uncharacterized protein n=1 Tax=Neolentinus lepideus HHB14362 ss-1 TaxID=1314782 RepID=A0A165PVU7_9AGAM|nr:hypothetical protein NEOLEDRAFT_740941 [Neolentinus lepideus HHB14362 ss-1]